MKSLTQTLRLAALCLAVIGLTRETGAQVLTTNYWTGASGVDTNWTTANNWTNFTVPPTNGAPTATGIALFTNTAALGSPLTPGTNNNTVNASFTISALQYANWAVNTAPNYQVTLVGSGQTLTATNGLMVGTSTDAGNTAVVNAVITGAGGKFKVTGGTINVRQGTATAPAAPPFPYNAKLDMSQLDTFNATVSRVLLAADGGGGALQREIAIVYLAKTNVITANGTAPAISLADNPNTGAGGNTDPTAVSSYLYLGMTNTINADTIGIGRQKCAGFMSFNPAFTNGATPSVYIRGVSGGRVSTFSVGDMSPASTSNQRSLGLVDFSGGTVDLMIDTAYLGRGNNGNNTGTDGRPAANGTLTISQGVININTMEVGYQTASGTGFSAVGTLNVNGTGVLAVNNIIELAHKSPTNSGVIGTLNVNGGSLRANNIVGGGGTNYINVTGGTLSITNAAGTVATPLGTLSLTNGALNLSPVGSTNIVMTTLNLATATPETINISAVPGIAVYPAQFALIAYTTVSGDPGQFVLGTLPPATTNYQGYLSNNTSAMRVDLVLTNGPLGQPLRPSKTVTWNGVTNGVLMGDWDLVTTNWVSAGQPTNYANATTVAGYGDMALFDDTLKGTTTVNLTASLNPTNVTVNNTLSNYVFTGLGRLSGMGGLVKSGPGMLTLAGSGGDNFSGGVAVNGGVLLLDNASSGISGNSTVAAGAMLQVGNNDAGGNMPAGTLTNNGALVFNRGDTALSVATVIAGTGGVTNIGSGTVTITASGSFTGPTVVNAGTLALNGNNGYPSTISTSSGLTINSGGTTLILNDNSLGNPTGTPVTINTGGTLTGNNTSSHLRSLLTLAGGTLAMGGAVSQAGNGTWDLDGGVTVNGGANTSTISAIQVVPTQVGGTIFDVASGGTPSGIDLNVTGTLINGTGIHDTGIIKNNNGTMALDSFNTYTNGTLINGGVLQLGEAGDVAPLTLPLGTAGVTNNATLSIASSQSVTVSNVISGTGSLWVGNGTAILAASDTYTGNTTVSNAVLQFAGGGGIANSPTLTMVNGTLVINGSIGFSSMVSLTNGTLKLATPLNVANISLVAPTLNVSGAGTTNFIQAQNVPPIPAYPQVFPVIQYSNLNGSVSSFAAGVPAGYSGFISNDVSGKLVDLVLTNGPITPLLTWFGANGGALNSSWDFSTTDWSNTVTHVIAPYVDGSLVTLNDTGATNVVNLTTTFAPAGTTVTNSKTYTFVGVGGLDGTNGVTKLGSGTLVLDNTGANTFTGGLNIGAGGTVQMGSFDTAGSLGGGTVSANGGLVIERTDNPVLSNSISGSGSISQLGTNSTLTLSGANSSFSGTVVVTNSGTLQAGNAQALGTSVTTIAGGSSLDINGNALAGAQIVVSGIGLTNVDGTTNGAIINSSASSAGPPAVKSVTLQGDTVFGAPTEGVLANSSVLSNRWDIRGTGASLNGGYNITKVSFNQISLSGVTVDPTLGNIDVQNGILSVETTTTGLGDPSKTLTVENGATLSIYGATNQFNKNIVLNGYGINNNLGTINNANGNNTIAGPVTVNGDVQITFRNNAGNAVGGALVISNLATGMSGPGSLTKNDTNTLTVGGLDTHSGGTIINDGTFILNGMSTAAANSLTINTHTLAVATTLGGNGTNKGPVVVNDTMWPGVGGKPSSFGAGNGTVSPSLQFTPGAVTAVFNLGSTTTAGGGVNDLINVAGDFDAGGANVQINPVGLLTTSGAYTLVNYTGSMLSSSFNQNVNVVPAAQPSRYVFSVSYPAHQVQLTVTTGVGLMEWNGASGDGLWNVQNSQNWLNTATVTPQAPKDYQFLQGDQVVLDNSIIASGGTNVLTITTNNPVKPSSITVNSTTNYTIQGPGSIVGNLNITKANSSALTISTPNTFVGTVTINGGSIVVNNANALGSTNNTIIVTNGGALDVGGPSFAANANPLLGYRLVELSGFGSSGAGLPNAGAAGVKSNGCLINTGTLTQENAAQNVLLTGDTAIGGAGIINGAGRIDIGRVTPNSFSTGGHPYNLYKVGSNQVSFVALTVDPALMNVDIQGGELGIETSTTGLGNPAGTVTVEQGATLEFYQLFTNLNKFVVITGNGVTTNIWFNSGAGYPTNAIVGTVTLTNTVVVGGGASGAFSNVISGPGGLSIFAGGGRVVLDATNTYTGNTTIGSGTLLLAGNASFNNSTNIFLGGGTLDVSARVDSTLTLNGQTLSGKGTINGSLTNFAGVISLAATNGTLTVTNDAQLGGVFTNQLGQGSNTVFVVGSDLTYGGTLTVTTNAATTTPLVAGSRYRLFKAASYNGTFSSITLPALGPNLAWTNGLAVDGSIGVVNTVLIPGIPATITGFGLSGTNLVINGTNGVNGGVYYLLSSTNVALPLSQWTPVSTNVVNTNGATGNGFSLTGTNVVFTNGVQQFYILSNTN